MRTALVALAALLAACAAAIPPPPVAATYVVVVPPPGDVEAPAAGGPAADRGAACPPDTLNEKGRCVRVIASPEIPAWEAPRGHGDPCATWTSEKGLFDCDVKNESGPDGGRSNGR